MYFVWMPYLRIRSSRHNVNEVVVGKARFLPDSDQVWTEVLNRSRPEHLKMFRSFPPVRQNIPGEPIRGTVVVADDQEWLRTFCDEAVAAVYFLGDQPYPGRPAECFAYHALRMKESGGKPADWAEFTTKHGTILESGTSIVVYPPLVTRAQMGEYELRLNTEESKRLLSLLESDPQHRLVVAVRLYFRTQFSDVFTSTVTEDFATHCGVVEAALDIDTRHMAGDKFVEMLTGIYGTENGLPQFFLGLYVARSLYVHGASTTPATQSRTKEFEAYRFFLSRRAKLTALRVMSRDLILRALGRPVDPFGFDSPDSADRILKKVLLSDEIWDAARKLLTKGRAADRITNMNEAQFKEVEDLAVSMILYLEWGCIPEQIESDDLFSALCTCALLAARLTNSDGDVYQATDKLGKAADKRDANAVRDWLWEHYDWKDLMIGGGKRLVTIQSMARTIAGYFEHAGQNG